ncbi:10682_t:CDS:2 [Ambispora leptoticha]|uniref:10682_t:CDS:1 n=2 Tax=Glomeromycetes TaxID=214506 RepID=A0A9N8YUL3_9GLOM|nr:10682_t:CDS:2 [Ambispora leptoticha]
MSFQYTARLKVPQLPDEPFDENMWAKLWRQGVRGFRVWDFGTLQKGSQVATGCNAPNLPAYQVSIPVSDVFWNPPIIAGVLVVSGYVEMVPNTINANNFNIDLYSIQQLEKCILIAQILLNEEPVVEYRPSFMEGLELDAFFRSNRIALEVQGAQHRLHNTSWYKDVKKLEDIVNRDRKKRTLCQLNGIYLLEVWYDENPEVTIPKKIYKFREFIDRKIFNLD